MKKSKTWEELIRDIDTAKRKSQSPSRREREEGEKFLSENKMFVSSVIEIRRRDSQELERITKAKKNGFVSVPECKVINFKTDLKEGILQYIKNNEIVLGVEKTHDRLCKDIADASSAHEIGEILAPIDNFEINKQLIYWGIKNSKHNIGGVKVNISKYIPDAVGDIIDINKVFDQIKLSGELAAEIIDVVLS